jgi:hypothetical protein
VIGAQGSRIASIQDESGARVHIIRPQKEKGMREVLGSGRFLWGEGRGRHRREMFFLINILLFQPLKSENVLDPTSNIN